MQIFTQQIILMKGNRYPVQRNSSPPILTARKQVCWGAASVNVSSTPFAAGPDLGGGAEKCSDITWPGCFPPVRPLKPLKRADPPSEQRPPPRSLCCCRSRTALIVMGHTPRLIGCPAVLSSKWYPQPWHRRGADDSAIEVSLWGPIFKHSVVSVLRHAGGMGAAVN